MVGRACLWIVVGSLAAGCGQDQPVGKGAAGDRAGAATSATIPAPAVPIAVQGVQEPDELRVPPYPTVTLSPPEQALADEIKQIAGTYNPLTSPEPVNRVLAKFPDWPDGHAARALVRCQGSDPAAVLNDLNGALPDLQHQREEGQQLLLTIRAKLEHTAGDDAAALKDLDRALQIRLDNMDQFLNLRAVASEITSTLCVWQESDFTALALKFPQDARPLMLRGLYRQREAETTSNDPVNAAVIADFRHAGEVQSSLALPHYLIAQALLRWSFLTTYNKPADQQRAYDQQVLDELNAALERDPAFEAARLKRGTVYIQRKDFTHAIADFDAALRSDPRNYTALQERARAKLGNSDVRGAIEDFSGALDSELASAAAQAESPMATLALYRARAEAYAQAQEWNRAAQDYTQTISLELGSMAVLINIQQFRALYPEYHAASDEAIAHKLHRTFDPNLSYEAFAQRFLHENVAHGFYPSALLPDLLMARADANLKAGQWHQAQVDYRRAVAQVPNYPGVIDRWRELPLFGEEHVYVDLKTFDDTHLPERVELWIKEAKSTDAAFSLTREQINCKTHQISSATTVPYDTDGNARGTHTSATWESVVPESLGETLYLAVCHGA